MRCARLTLPLLLLTLALPTLTLTACAEPDPAPEAAPHADPEPDAAPAPLPCDGLDTNNDGHCDRDTADFTATARIPPGTHRADIYHQGQALPATIAEGLLHAQVWPVEPSGILMPHAAVERALDPAADDPRLLSLRAAAAAIVGFETTPEFYAWLGLPPYNPPDITALGPPYAATPGPRVPPGAPMAVGVIDTPHVPALTFSCTACHAGRLLGRTVIGLANRQPRANAFFRIAKSLLPTLSSSLLLDVIHITPAEQALIDRTLAAAARVDTRQPLALGLDTSLAQVALSLARRSPDAYATPDPTYQIRPRQNPLATLPADSKPMPWWTLKYKTRWLADGSLTTGNPVLTNFLWNEIGRGTDLHELEDWMRHNPRAIDTLTAAVFATTPPRWTDYFPPDTIDLEAARRGQQAFALRCARCHGTYEKAWDTPAPPTDPITLLTTTRVIYHERTPIHDVGTDPHRHQGMQHFAAPLNALAISQWMQTTIEPQTGYVPPPLDAIWARYPYLHNNSIPTLCALLTPESRPLTFRQGPSEDPDTDFDPTCVGYPTGDAIPPEWEAIEDSLIDTTRPGLSNQGHTLMLDGTDGTPPITPDERADLIEFLKTL